MNKRAEQMAISKTITAVLVVLVVVIVLFFLISSDNVRNFFKEVFPDYFLTNGTSTNLTVKADVYGSTVLLLINDGNGRCIITEVLFSPDPELGGELVKYGIRENELIIRDDGKSEEWRKADVKVNGEGLDRVTTFMLENSGSLYTKENSKNQLIKQDLYFGCYHEEEDLKNAKVLGFDVKILEKDENRRCLIFESPDSLILEHYALEESLFEKSKLYFLSLGKWELAEILTPEQKEELALVEKLEKLEDVSRDLNLYFSDFTVDLCKMSNREQCEDEPSEDVVEINEVLKKINEPGADTEELLLKIKEIADKEDFDEDDFRIYFSSISEGVEKKSFDIAVRTFSQNNNLDENFIIWESGRGYIRQTIEGKIYYYSGGNYFTREDSKYVRFESDYFEMPDYKKLSLLNSETIKSDLENAC